MLRVTLWPCVPTSIVALPSPTAVAFPVLSISITARFVLDQFGNFAEGGTPPSPNSSFAENVNVSPTRSLSIAGVICADTKGASGDI